MPVTGKPSVLFVCTGNICRSPTAEGVFRHLVRQSGLEDRVRVDSAGTHGYHIGEPPDARSVLAARRRGYDLSSLRARQVVPEDFLLFSHIIALDRGHLAFLERMSPPEGRGRLSLMMAHARVLPGVEDVPDPYYGQEDGFERVLDMIEDAAEGLLKSLVVL